MPTTAEYIKGIFDPFYKADLKQWEHFSDRLTERHFHKNEVIKSSNSVEKYLNIIIKGSVGLFIWNGRQEVCLNLMYENDFFSDYLSFLKQEQTPLTTIALEETQGLSITHSDLKALYQNSTSSIHIARIAAEVQYAKKQQEQINLLTMTAEERYIRLITQQPRIIQRTPLKYIASYLGITAESLSRVRKKIAG